MTNQRLGGRSILGSRSGDQHLAQTTRIYVQMVGLILIGHRRRMDLIEYHKFGDQLWPTCIEHQYYVIYMK